MGSVKPDALARLNCGAMGSWYWNSTSNAPDSCAINSCPGREMEDCNIGLFEQDIILNDMTLLDKFHRGADMICHTHPLHDNGQSSPGESRNREEFLVDDFLVDDDGQDAVLETIGEKDVAEAGADDGADALFLQRPYRALAPADTPGAEV